MMASGQLVEAGLVTTNGIRGGASREVLKPIVREGRIFEAWGDEEWTVDGAAVRVSLICFDALKAGAVRLNGNEVSEIFSDLTASHLGIDLSQSARLVENSGISFQGVSKVGQFEIDGDLARAWLIQPKNPNGQPNSAVLRQWITGTDLTVRNRDEWVVDFGLNATIEEAALFELPFKKIETSVFPSRQTSRREAYRKKWWIHGEARPGMRKAIAGFSRYIATPKVSKYRFFVFFPISVLSSNLVIAIARDDDTSFGVLSSRIHEIWSLAMGQWIGVGNDPTYTPSTTFETFPFPDGLTPNVPAADYAADPRAVKIATHAARLNELRENWLKPADLVKRVTEVVPGYPDRILPVDDNAAKELKKRTLTNLYNARPAWLDHAHKALDEAVAEAYGWGDDWRAGLLTDDEILARLFKLNQDCSAAQAS